MIRRPPRSTLFPYTTLFRSGLIALKVINAVDLCGPFHFSGGKFPAPVADMGKGLGLLIKLLALLKLFDQQDRKSTRLNSSHANISYAVFCLKKKKNTLINLY